MTRRTTLLAPAVLAVGLGLAACTQTTDGQSTAQATTTTQAEQLETTSTTPPVSSTVAPPGSPDYLTQETLCRLLTEADLAGLGLRPVGEPGEFLGDEECLWQSGGNGSLTVTYRAEDGVAELREVPGATYTDVTIGAHTGVRGAQPDGDRCGVDLVITDNSSLGIIGVGGPGRGCELIDLAAPLIEANLP